MHNTHTPKAHPHISSPGELLSNIPGMLGFYPTDSVIFISLEQPGSGAHTDTGISLGPLIRVDIPDIFDAWADASDLLNTPHCVCIFAFIISQRPQAEIADISDLLYALGDVEAIAEDSLSAGVVELPGDSGGTTVDAAWWVEEICAGESYELIFGPTSPDGAGPLQDWEHGKIPAITASQSMRHCVDNHVIPELNRGDMMERFSRSNPCMSPESAAAMAEAARRAGLELRNNLRIRGTESTLSAAELIEDAPRLLAEVASVEETYRDHEMLATVALWLSTTWVRDLVVSDLIEQPQAASKLLLAAAHTFKGTIRANALALYAAVELTTECIVYAGPALHVLREEEAHHSLGNLIFAVYRAGKFEIIASSMQKGCRVARAAALGEETTSENAA
ncbi:DUF4192 domain-containing protein [Corynebacterium flavescens]|uniref:DUF4192 domain-containing protein n=1 Tax=Corynebacterium flavescens TaxID=28028 RepID=UPI003FD0F7A5